MRIGNIGVWLVPLAGLVAVPATAQTTAMDHSDHMAAEAGMNDDMGATMNGVMGHDTAAMDHAASTGIAPVREPGQGAFAAIAEIVAALSADPETDWSLVDINALRAHLVDMDLVTTRASATVEAIDGGMRFTVTGTGDVVGAAQRMVVAHAGIIDGENGWQVRASTLPDRAVLEVRVPDADMAKLRGLGFFGVLAQGMHHQAHHWMMATGQDPHS